MTFLSSQKTIPLLEGTVTATIASSLSSMESLTETSNSHKFPVETWKTIFEKLTSPGDLYNVAITSHYIHDIVTPILYRRLFIDPNYYSTYTFSLLRRNPALARRITSLTLLRPIHRTIPPCLLEESTKLYRTLDLPLAPIPRDVKLRRNRANMPPLPDLDQEICVHRPIIHLFPLFTNLSTLYIVRDCVPTDFLLWICELPQLTTLEIRDSTVSPDLKQKYPPTPLPLRTLTLTLAKCWERDDHFGNYVPGQVCEALLKNAPFLASLTINSSVVHVACQILSDMTHPPPIKTLLCYADPSGSLFCRMLMNLPTITSLHIARVTSELGPILPRDSLPQLQALTGELKSLGIFFGAHRPLQYLTITDSPGRRERTPWEPQLIYFLESVRKYEPNIKSLAFNLTTWSEEVFLCICQLWPGLKELRIQCMLGSGVDEYFRISFGPRFLPQLRHLEVLHIYQRAELRFTRMYLSKGVPAISHSPITLSTEEAEDLKEAPFHYRRWEKICPSLREVAFDREFWWSRACTEPGGWTLMTDIIPALKVS